MEIFTKEEYVFPRDISFWTSVKLLFVKKYKGVGIVPLKPGRVYTCKRYKNKIYVIGYE